MDVLNLFLPQTSNRVSTNPSKFRVIAEVLLRIKKICKIAANSYGTIALNPSDFVMSQEVPTFVPIFEYY